jgi:hypothetical protein
MKTDIQKFYTGFLILTILFSFAISQEQSAAPVFKQEEIEQILAPIALYPDSLLSQILMASTYPFEVIQAQRWVEQNKSLTGDALITDLEKQTWDPSVKSLVNFPQVLTMMNEKLDWTQKLGDAFLAQQKDVMTTVQELRKKANEAGNLKSTDKQVVKIEPNSIIIEYANPQVVYVPTYDPTVVYGSWSYPAYPPYYYYPPEYYPGAPWVYYNAGYAWGYAWGHCDWDDHDINIDVDHNLGDNIDRGEYINHYKNSERFENGKGKWQHNPENRKGVAYRDQATAQRFNKASTADAIKSREDFRGRTDAGRFQGADTIQRGDLQTGNRAGTRDISSGNVANRGSTLEGINRGGSTRPPTTTSTPNRANTLDNNSGGAVRPPSSFSASSRGGAFDSMDRGSSVRNYSSRGNASRQNMSRPSGGMSGGSRGGAGMGGGSRGGGGGRGGGRR